MPVSVSVSVSVSMSLSVSVSVSLSMSVSVSVSISVSVGAPGRHGRPLGAERGATVAGCCGCVRYRRSCCETQGYCGQVCVSI